MSSESYMDYINEVVYPNISTASAILAFIVVLTMIALSIYDFKLVDRVSLRLQTAISALDIWTHTTAFWFIYYKEEGPLCSFIAWQRFFGPLLYLFLNAAVALNLHLIFLTSYSLPKWMELVYWLGPIVLGLLITIPIAATGILGHGAYNDCFLRDTTSTNVVLAEVFGSMIWTIAVILYCTVIVVLVVIKLNKNAEKIRLSSRFITRESKQAEQMVMRLIYRLLLYPLVCILSTTGVLISQIYTYARSGQYSIGLDTWANVSLALTGTMNFVAFIMDPTFQAALYTVFRRIRGTEGEQADQNKQDQDVTVSYALYEHDKDNQGKSSFKLPVNEDLEYMDSNEPFTKEVNLL